MIAMSPGAALGDEHVLQTDSSKGADLQAHQVASAGSDREV